MTPLIYLRPLLERCFENGLLNVSMKQDGEAVLQVRVFGMWIGVATLTAQECREAQKAMGFGT